MRVFVAGATGVLGTELVPLLTAEGHQVAGVSRSQDGDVQLKGVGARPLRVDLFDRAALRPAVADTDVVINLATAIPPLSKMGDRHVWDLNDRLRTEGASNLAGVAAEVGVATFIQPSITMVYADGGDRWLDESSPIDPPSLTLHSALEAEATASGFTESGGRGVVLRLARLYGPGRASAEHVDLLRQGRVAVIGDGSNYVSSLHVHDSATAHLAGMQAPSGIYNVGDDRPLTSLELTTMQSQAVGGPTPPNIPSLVAHSQFGEAFGLLTVSHRVSNARFKRTCGWAPVFQSAADGLDSLRTAEASLDGLGRN